MPIEVSAEERHGVKYVVLPLYLLTVTASHFILNLASLKNTLSDTIKDVLNTLVMNISYKLFS